MNSEWLLQTINSTLLGDFLKKLETDFTDLEFEVYLDPEIDRYKIIVKKSFVEILKTRLSSKYFINYKSRIYLNTLSPEIQIDNFIKYRKALNDKKVSVGAIVRLTIDGLLYMIESIDLNKSTAIITRVGKNTAGVSIRVGLGSLMPTLQE